MVRKPQSRTVFVLDDDPQCISSTTHLLESCGYAVESFSVLDIAIDALLHARKKSETVLLLNLRMPVVSEFDALDLLNQKGVAVPVVCMTAQADVPTVVAAMGRGAITILEKPLKSATLNHAMRAAFSNSVQLRRSVRTNKRELMRTQARLGSLTHRESQIVRGLLADLSNVEIADEFNISIKTVELYRSKVMSKLGAKNAAHLVRMVMSH